VTVEAPAGRSAYRVRLDVFEGPLDLLLHLIRREEMDIYDIPIARITAQYLEYLEVLDTIDLDRASEFLVMAATLIDLKSRMLLPRPPAAEFIDDEAQADPRRELVARLLEYRRYKEAAGLLGKRASEARRQHSRYGGPGGPVPPARPGGVQDAGRPGPAASDSEPGAAPGAGAAEGCLEGVSLADLVAALQEVLRGLEEREAQEIVRESVTVAAKMEELATLLREAGDTGLDFSDILRRARTRRGAVVTFLALLELLRQARVRAVQERTFGPIRVWATPALARWGWPGRG
jgi:segregation and condensation protein A